jgi:hypothetical protein
VLHFSHPWGFALLGLAAPLIVLYILKIRKQRITVGSTWLWQLRERDLLARDPFRKFIAERSLLLQLLVLLVLATALAGPRLGDGGSPPPKTLAIVIDVSASMSATSSAGSRLELAKARAKRALEELPPGGQAMLVSAGATPRFLTGLEMNPLRLGAAIDALQGVDEIGDLPAAVGAAAERIRREPVPRLLVLSDGQTRENIRVSGVEVDNELVGEPANNVTLRAVDLNRTNDRRVEVFCVVEHHGNADFEGALTVQRNDRVLGLRTFRVAAGKQETLTLSIETPAEEATLKVAITSEGQRDALPQDSVAYVQVPRARKMTVVHASANHASWVGRALLADTNVDLQQLSPEQLSRVNIEPDAFVVTEGICPEQHAASIGMDWLVFAPAGETCADARLTREKGHIQTVTSWELTDPRLRFITFDDVHIGETALGTLSGARALVRSSKGALIFQGGDPSRTVTVVGFDPAKSDWPLRASFVIFMRNVTEYARTHRERLTSGAQAIGEPMRIPLPQNVTAVTSTLPDGTTQTLRAEGGLLLAPAPAKIGIYTYRWTTPLQGYVAVPVNLLSEREADLSQAPLSVTVERDAQGRVPARTASRANLLFAALGLLLVLLETSLFVHRRRAKP